MANNITPVNNLGNWTVGQTWPLFELPLTRTDANGNISRVMDLTGVTTGQLSMILYTSAKVVASNSPGTGVFTISNVKPGVVTYAQTVADMVTGVSYLRVRINFSSSSPDYSDLISISVAN